MKSILEDELSAIAARIVTLSENGKTDLFCGFYKNILTDIDFYGAPMPDGFDRMSNDLERLRKNRRLYNAKFQIVAWNYFNQSEERSAVSWLCRSMMKFCDSQSADSYSLQHRHLYFAIKWLAESISVLRGYSNIESLAVIKSWME